MAMNRGDCSFNSSNVRSNILYSCSRGNLEMIALSTLSIGTFYFWKFYVGLPISHNNVYNFLLIILYVLVAFLKYNLRED